MHNEDIIFLCSNDDFSKIVYNSICKTYDIKKVIIEEKEPKKKFILRRVKRLGLFTVFGQLIFQIFISKLLYLFSKQRIKEIVENNTLDLSSFPSEKLLKVNSINSIESINSILACSPKLILINGTRILSKKLLASINCKVINIHAGITPKYRGVHGAYWALVNNDKINAGVTVHFVDEGIDTGNVLAQEKIEIGYFDNFSTYPYLQISKGVVLLNQVVDSFFNNEVKVYQNNLDSGLYYHPTIFQYLYYRVFKGVK
jgi:folate-dependent phosphoribosylglycinamide formyltransferase PurN